MFESKDPHWAYKCKAKESQPHPVLIVLGAVGLVGWFWLVMSLLDAMVLP